MPAISLDIMSCAVCELKGGINMSKSLDAFAEELIEEFKIEIHDLKEEEFDMNYIEFIKIELRERLLIEKDKELEDEILRIIKEELDNKENQDLENALLTRIDLIQILIYQIFYEKFYKDFNSKYDLIVKSKKQELI